jgi:hypothetical protein
MSSVSGRGYEPLARATASYKYKAQEKILGVISQGQTNESLSGYNCGSYYEA